MALSSNTKFAKTLRYSTAALALFAMSTPEVQAQQDDQSAQLEIDQIIVTGTRIIRDGYDAPTPVSVLGVDELNNMAVTNISEAVNRMPAFTNSLTTENSSAADMTGGVQNLNLRGINPNRTLILVDGKRIVGTTLAGFNNNGGAVDINAIPNGLVSRVDVVTGGASAVYGSDALAGVVNFVFDNDYQGIKGDVTGGITSRGDGENYKVSLTAGTAFAGGKGHFLFFGEHTFNNGVTNGFPDPEKARGWSEASPTIVANPAHATDPTAPQWFIEPNSGFAFGTPGGIILGDDVFADPTDSPLYGIMFTDGGVPAPFRFGTRYGAAHGGAFTGEDTDFEISRINQDPVLASRLKRVNFYVRGSYDFADNFSGYAELGWSYTDSLSVSGVPQFEFGGITVLRENPFIPDEIGAIMDANGITSLSMSSSNQGSGLKQFGANNNRIVRRYVGGLEGNFDAMDTNWDWDFSYAKSTSHASVRTLGTFIRARKTEAQDAVRDPVSGAIVCRSTLTNPDNGCVPWNPMGIGVNSEAAINYISRPNYSLIKLTQDVFSASASGEPLSTWAGPVSVAFGIEHRVEKGRSIASELDQSRAFFAGNFTETDGKYDVTEGFIEAVVPLATNQDWAESLDINGSVRGTSYSTSGYVTTWKVGATYTPFSDLTIRATRSRDIRAPGLGELFIAGRSGTGQVTDPANGVSSIIVTRIEGNTDLKPEKADTTGVGVVFQPQWLPGFATSLDFYNIDIKGAIVSLAAQNTVTKCFEGFTELCDDIERDANGIINFVRVLPQNVLVQKAQGLDIEASYSFDMSDIMSSWEGSMSLRALGTYYLKLTTDDGDSVIDGAGSILSNGLGAGGGLPISKYRYMISATYTYDAFSGTITTRGEGSRSYYDGAITCTSACPVSTPRAPTIAFDNKVPGHNLWDLALNYKIMDDTAELFFVTENLFDTDPPLIAGNPQSGYWMGQDNNDYDRIGRKFRAGVRFTY